MRIRAIRKLTPLLLVALVSAAAPAYGQEEPEKRLRELEREVELLRQQVAGQDSAAIAEIRRQIEAIAREIEELKLGREVVVQADSGVYGFGPAASKVYQVTQGVSIGGYGEILYEHFSDEREDGDPSEQKDQIDFLRAVVYVGYKFNDQFIYNSEIEFEHSTTDQVGSVSVEFAYLDYLISDHVGARAGLVLVPMGFINELHEPPTFLGTQRPETESRIIPTTWRENGIGVFGGVGGLTVRGYLVNGLDAVGDGSSGATGFSAAGLRGGRQKGSKAVAEDFAGVVRLDYEGVLGLLVGTSVYAGDSGQGNVSPLDSASIDALTVIWEGHAEYRARGLDLRGLFALAQVDDVERLNAAKGLAEAESVGERLIGWYLQAGYDVLHRARTAHALIPYVRYEQINTQDKVPAGVSSNPAMDQQVWTLGVAWKPISNLVVKADYQVRSDKADTGVNQVNVNIGYLF
jgi:hypothetical protein